MTDLVPVERRIVHYGAPPLTLRTASEEEALEIHAQAEAVEAYAKAREAWEQYHAAGAAKLWAERRLGELRAASRRTDGRKEDIGLGGFDERIGLKKWHARKYELMSRIPPERFSEILQEIQESDGAYNASGVLGRDDLAYETRVAPGIYRIRDGRLVLQWKKAGSKHRETLNTDKVDVARRELAIRRDLLPARTRKDDHRSLESAAALTRRALDVLDNVPTQGMPASAKRSVEAAFAALYKAEDALLKARLEADA